MISLGIETSCDDTCVSLTDEQGEVLFSKRQNQNLVHDSFGGIVPELAGRNHEKYLLSLINEAKLFLKNKEIDLISVTNRPGLLGSLLVGVLTARTLALVWKKPISYINHIEAHVFSPFLWKEKEKRKEMKFPFLSLIASGGHSHLFLVKDFNQSILLAKTLDDASGEALDKFAKLLGFPFPGGKYIDQESKNISSSKYNFFSPIQTKDLNFSFSGIKSSGYRLLEDKSDEWKKEHLAHLCYDYQKKIIDHLMDKLDKVFKEHPCKQICIGGGVSANSYFRNCIETWAHKKQIEALIPDLEYATDNASMISFLGTQYFTRGIKNTYSHASPKHFKDDFFVFR